MASSEVDGARTEHNLFNAAGRTGALHVTFHSRQKYSLLQRYHTSRHAVLGTHPAKMCSPSAVHHQRVQFEAMP